jgi:hypothetical protein
VFSAKPFDREKNQYKKGGNPGFFVMTEVGNGK